MGELLDKTKGHANEAMGKAKRAIGDALDYFVAVFNRCCDSWCSSA